MSKKFLIITTNNKKTNKHDDDKTTTTATTTTTTVAASLITCEQSLTNPGSCSGRNFEMHAEPLPSTFDGD